MGPHIDSGTETCTHGPLDTYIRKRIRTDTDRNRTRDVNTQGPTVRYTLPGKYTCRQTES